jgi:hypothetical protein
MIEIKFHVFDNTKDFNKFLKKHKGKKQRKILEFASIENTFLRIYSVIPVETEDYYTYYLKVVSHEMMGQTHVLYEEMGEYAFQLLQDIQPTYINHKSETK